jgi:hypothetical protein
MRFQENYGPLRNDHQDPRRQAYYQYTMHLSLVAGPLRIAAGDFPNRKWMLDLAADHLTRSIDYEV